MNQLKTLSIIAVGLTIFVLQTAAVHAASEGSELMGHGVMKKAEEIHHIFQRDDFLYVADGEKGVRIYNNSDTSKPKHISTYKTFGSAEQIDNPGECNSNDLRRTSLFVADGEKGLHVIDIADNKKPKFRNSIDTAGYAHALTVLDDGRGGCTAYIAGGSAGFQVIDVSDVEALQKISRYDTAGDAQDMYHNDDYVYVADGKAGLQIINVSDEHNLTLAGTFSTKGAAEKIISYSHKDGYVYVQEKDYGIEVIDVSNPENPRLQAVLPFEEPVLSAAVERNDNYLYIGFRNEVQMYDIREYANPTLTKIAKIKNVDKLEYIQLLARGLLYVSDADGVLIYNFQLHEIAPEYSPEFTETTFLQKEGNYLFSAERYSDDSEPAVTVFDASDQLNPVLLGNFGPTAKSRHSLLVAGDYAYVGYREEKHRQAIDVYDISDINDIQLVGNYKFSAKTSPRKLLLHNNHLYMSLKKRGVYVLNVANPAEPQLAQHYKSKPEIVDDIAIEDDKLYFVQKDSLYKYDISNDEEWTMTKKVFLEGPPYGNGDMRVVNGRLFVSEYKSLLRIYNVEKNKLELMSNYDEKYSFSESIVVAASNKYAFLNTGRDYIVIDIAKPKKPQILTRLAISASKEYGSENWNQVLLVDDYIYATNPAGTALDIFSLSQLSGL